MSIALVIGLIITIQLSLFPTTAFAPHLIVLTVIAALVSLGFSWLFSRVTPSILPRLLGNISDREIQLIFYNRRVNQFIRNGTILKVKRPTV